MNKNIGLYVMVPLLSLGIACSGEKKKTDKKADALEETVKSEALSKSYKDHDDGYSPRVSYIVQKNDNLMEIAGKHDMSLAELLKYNPQIKNPNLITPHQKIYLE